MKILKITSKANLIIMMSLFIVAFSNVAFFKNVLEIYPLTAKKSGFLVSLVIVLTNVIIILLTLLSSRFIIKPLLIVLLITALASYFMDSYGVVIDHNMIDSSFKTDVSELLDLLSVKLVLYFACLGILPSIYIYRVTINYASFIREHKSLRYYTNPTYSLYSVGKYLNKKFNSKNDDIAVVALGLDAHISETSKQKKLVILVVGETARADRFSLNGYSQPTNPYLEQEDIISFSDFYSFGTSTAISVPCMFSVFTHDDFTLEKANNTENLLDVLTHAGVNVLWRDNKSNSKGVAKRVTYEDYKTQAKKHHL